MEEAKEKKASSITKKNPKQNHDLKNWGCRWWEKRNPTNIIHCARFLFFFLGFSNLGLLGAPEQGQVPRLCQTFGRVSPCMCVCVYPHHLEIWCCALIRWAILSEQDHTNHLYLPVNRNLQWLQHLLHKKNVVRTYNESEHWLSLWTMTLKVGML